MNYEFSLYLLRNPDARQRLAPQREETIRWIADYVTGHVDRLDGELRLPAETRARVLVASTEGILVATHTSEQDLLGPYLQFVMANLIARDGR